MNDSSKERSLHRIIAASAFFCALCILPVAQHFLNPPADAGGQVAGVSTDTGITSTRADFSPQDCTAKRTKDLTDLERYSAGTRIAFDTDYSQKTTPYDAAKKALIGTPESVARETVALDALIEGERTPYLKKLSDFDGAVSSQKNEIESRSCAAE